MKHLIRCGKLVLKSEEIPRWVKALAIVALLPIPGPLDEFVGLVTLGIIAVWYRPILEQAWRKVA